MTQNECTNALLQDSIWIAYGAVSLALLASAALLALSSVILYSLALSILYSSSASFLACALVV